MGVFGTVRWMAFATYVIAFFAIPLGILWGKWGLVAGMGMGIALLAAAGIGATERIATKLKLKFLTRAEAPRLFAMTEELCRRSNQTMPRIAVMESPAVNSARFGTNSQNAVLMLTRGAIEGLNREELAALVGRQLVSIRRDNLGCETWLTQFLSLLDSAISPLAPRRRSASPRFYPFQLFLRQAFLYPLCLLPARWLRSPRPPELVDREAAGPSPRKLAESLRRIQSQVERVPFHAPFSTRHLFLLPPVPQDPMGRIFFGSESLSKRIRFLERAGATV